MHLHDCMTTICIRKVRHIMSGPGGPRSMPKGPLLPGGWYFFSKCTKAQMHKAHPPSKICTIHQVHNLHNQKNWLPPRPGLLPDPPIIITPGIPGRESGGGCARRVPQSPHVPAAEQYREPPRAPNYARMSLRKYPFNKSNATSIPPAITTLHPPPSGLYPPALSLPT